LAWVPPQPREFLDTVAGRLANDGFRVQRNVVAGPYALDSLASRVVEKKIVWGGTPIAYSEAVAVSSAQVLSPDDVRNYSSFFAKYALENHSLHAHWTSLSTVAALVSPSFTDDTKKWVSETTPEIHNLFWARLQFPVLVELDNREIIYPKRGPPNWGPICETLRYLADEWFLF
jgi:hypothetical protein